jgi:hypothetical protein
MNWRMMQIVQQKYTRMQNLLQYSRLTCLAGAVLVMCSLALILSGCTNPFITPSQSGNGSVPTLTPIASLKPAGSTTPVPNTTNITLQVASNCPSTIKWDKLVGTRVNVNKVQKVACGDLQGSGSLQALINVRYYSSDAKLDFYVYSNLSSTPTQAFKVQDLPMGDAQISPTNTIITAEIGPNGLPTTVPDLFKEYQWSGGGFVQVVFPGIYPDMTHYQAEQDQVGVNAGRNTNRTSGFPVVSALALRLCHWTQTSDKTLTYDSRQGIYLVQVSNLGPGGGGFIAKLFRLDNVLTNIFEVMQITPLDGSTSLSLPTPGAKINSPVHVSGSTPASGNVLAHLVVYDDSNIAIGDSGAIRGSSSGSMVNFTDTVSFQPNAHGVQEGVVAFFTTTQNNIELSNQVVMSKVLLSY